jgi:hypothetical protein
MRRVLSKQLVSERLVNEHARTSTRGVGEDGRKKDWKSGSDGDAAPRMRLVLARMQPVASMIAIAVCMRLFGLCLRLRLDRGTTRHGRGACATVLRMLWEEV